MLWFGAICLMGWFFCSILQSCIVSCTICRHALIQLLRHLLRDTVRRQKLQQTVATLFLAQLADALINKMEELYH